MQSKEYWETLGSGKTFEDPLYLEKFQDRLMPHSRIVDYGCGYGRLLDFLYSKGYHNLTGYDLSSAMIRRGMATYPHLNLKVIEQSGQLPEPDDSADLVVLSTVLDSIVSKQGQQEVIDEIKRVLKKNGLLYLSDFLITPDHFEAKYRRGLEEHGEYGVYTTGEGLVVRHFTTAWLTDLLRDWDLLWLEQFPFKTMNGTPTRSLHLLASPVQMGAKGH
ncbi:MAG: class I SAM-dependent methyltransferase [Parachlamydiales bacterium]